MAMQNPDEFNIQVEKKNQKNFQIQIDSQKQQFEDKINAVLSSLGKMSDQSQEAMTLFQKMMQLNPIVQELGAAVTTVDSDVYYKLYMKFRNVFKNFNTSANECTKISLQSLNAESDPQKLKEILNSIVNVANQLSQIKQNVFSETQRYVIWVDYYDSQENKKTLLKINQQYQNSMTVKFYTKISQFQQDFPKFNGQPLFLILSGQVANDYAPTDGKLFAWLKKKWLEDKNTIRIKGIIIYTSQQGVKHMKDKFIKDESKLVRCVTHDTPEMYKQLSSMISPSKFCRVVGIEEFSYFFSNEFKDKLLKLHITDCTKKISDFNPSKVDYAKMFKEAEELVKQNKISFDAEASQFQLVLDHLLPIFQKYNDETSLSKALIYLYTLQDVPFYKLINSSLNTMNEKLIQKLWPLIELFYTVIYHYNDSMYPETIKYGQSDQILYRGSSIPYDNYEDICKVNQFIALPSFSSFTPDKKIAINFAALNSYPNTISCIFIYNHNSVGKSQYNLRPKYISNDSKYKQEKEYLTYPCVTYKIQSINKKFDPLLHDYYEINLCLS